VLLVTGCGGAYPGAAATLDGYRVPMSTVDEQAAALCNIGPQVVLGSEAGQQVAARTFRAIALSVQVQLRQAELAAEELGIDVPADAATEEDLVTVGVPTEDLSEDDIDAVLHFYDDNIRVGTLRQRISQQLAEESGAEQQAVEEETAQFLEEQIDDVAVDPRLGVDENLEDTAASGSVSVAVSESARGLLAQDAAELESSVSDLPTDQSCG
jgi:hypothetical protein